MLHDLCQRVTVVKKKIMLIYRFADFVSPHNVVLNVAELLSLDSYMQDSRRNGEWVSLDIRGNSTEQR